MKSIKYSFLFTLLIIFLGGCGCASDKAISEPTTEKEQTTFAREFLSVFLKSTPATRKTLTKALQPKKIDIEAVFVDTAIQNRVLDYTQRLFEKEKFNIKCFPDYNKVLLWTASIEDFENGTGDAIEFPSSFFKIVPYLKEKTSIHRFKFTQEGYPAGASYEGLVYVNGRWVLFPKIWRVIEEL